MFGTLSCIKIHVTDKLPLISDSIYFLYMKPSILLIIFCNGPIQCQEKGPQTITFPPQCFKDFVVYVGAKLLFRGINIESIVKYVSATKRKHI